MQKLMDRSSDGVISKDELNELEALADLSETMSVFKAQAMQFLNQHPELR